MIYDGSDAAPTCSRAGTTSASSQQLLGYENLEITAIYTQVSIEQLKAVLAEIHPAESGGNQS